MRQHVTLAMFCMVSLVVFTAPSAYEIRTHEELTRVGGRRSTVDEILRTRLGLSNGLESVIRGQALTEWLAQGGRR
jgi:hypothetical protein